MAKLALKLLILAALCSAYQSANAVPTCGQPFCFELNGKLICIPTGCPPPSARSIP